MNYLLYIFISIIYIQAFPHGAPAKTCSYNLPIGSGKSHHGSYLSSDNRLSLSLFDSSNKIVTEYQPASIYTLQILSTETYTGYLFGAFDSISEAEYGSFSYFTDDKISKHISGVGCITQSNEVSLKTTKILWTSPSSTESIVHLQSVVTFDKQSSLITLSIRGIESHNKGTYINETISYVEKTHILTKQNIELFSVINIIIIIVLSGLLFAVSTVFVLSFIKIIGFKSKYIEPFTNVIV